MRSEHHEVAVDDTTITVYRNPRLDEMCLFHHWGGRLNPPNKRCRAARPRICSSLAPLAAGSTMSLPGCVFREAVDPLVLELIIDGVGIPVERVQDAVLIVEQLDLGFETRE